MIQHKIRSEVFLREDIQSILRAINAANAELAARVANQETEVYRAGFVDALQAVATALHVRLSSQPIEDSDPVSAWPASTQPVMLAVSDNGLDEG